MKRDAAFPPTHHWATFFAILLCAPLGCAIESHDPSTGDGDAGENGDGDVAGTGSANGQSSGGSSNGSGGATQSGGAPGSSGGAESESGGTSGSGGTNGAGGSAAIGGSGGGGYEPPNGNPIEVPAEFLVGLPSTGTGPICSAVDLHTIPAPPNPGYRDESLEDEVQSGDDLWEASFYMMLFANCERQARGLVPFKMWTDQQMVEMMETYRFQGGHTNFGERTDIVGGGGAEGAGGGPFIGAMMNQKDRENEDEDGDGLWSPHEVGRRPGTGLVDHGDAMVNPNNTCVWAGITIGPTADNYMNAVIFYGTSCE